MSERYLHPLPIGSFKKTREHIWMPNFGLQLSTNTPDTTGFRY